MLGNAILTPTMEECGKIKKFFYHRSDKTIGELEKELGDIFTIEAASFRKDREDCGEICCKGINKSYGMEKYLEYVGLTRKDAIAFGDGPNDLDMLSFAETGVAMGNGLEEVKKLADFVTKDIDEIFYNWQWYNFFSCRRPVFCTWSQVRLSQLFCEE